MAPRTFVLFSAPLDDLVLPFAYAAPPDRDGRTAAQLLVSRSFRHLPGRTSRGDARDGPAARALISVSPQASKTHSGIHRLPFDVSPVAQYVTRCLSA